MASEFTIASTTMLFQLTQGRWNEAIGTYGIRMFFFFELILFIEFSKHLLNKF
ncbi:hypothetical protein SAMN05518847_11268 [Paenibacillus sp. OV219]|nr:hypothetical protein SAMN05518847_11268 [Paenibacillus sp. OV219]